MVGAAGSGIADDDGPYADLTGTAKLGCGMLPMLAKVRGVLRGPFHDYNTVDLHRILLDVFYGLSLSWQWRD